jgi:hypothetical protein
MKLISVKAKARNNHQVVIETTYFNNRAASRLPFDASNGVQILAGPRTEAYETPRGIRLFVRGPNAQSAFYTPFTAFSMDAVSMTRRIKEAIHEFRRS